MKTLIFILVLILHGFNKSASITIPKNMFLKPDINVNEIVKEKNQTNLNTTNILEICNDKNNSYFFPQFYPMHNHDDYKVTNQGVYPGGQLTLIQTDAPTK